MVSALGRGCGAGGWLRRVPVLLMTAGDPASLPATVREAALSDVLETFGRRRLSAAAARQ